MGEANEEIRALGTQVMAVVPADLDGAREYARMLELPYPVISDPTRHLYRAFGLRKQWMLQRSAVFLIGTDMRLLHARTALNPNNAMDLEELLGALGARMQKRLADAAGEYGEPG